MCNRKFYATTALVFVIAIWFDVWWFSLPGLWHWQGAVACIGLFTFGYMASVAWQRFRASQHRSYADPRSGFGLSAWLGRKPREHQMRVERFTADCFTVYDAKGLDPINVVLQDYGGSGRIIVECYGNAWSTYFGAIGECLLREFLAGCHVDYVANRMDPKGGSYLKDITAAVLSALRSND